MPEIHKLLTSQKNQIYNIIEAEGLDPSNFSWTTEKSRKNENGTVPKLNYLDGEYFFLFDFSNGHYCFYSPGEVSLIEDNYRSQWGYQLISVKSWVHYLKRETHEPDLWQLIEKQKPLITGATLEESETTFFGKEEIERVKISVKDFRLLIESKFEPSTKQMEIIDNRLDYLSKAVDRLNRFDWKSLAISTVISITITLSLDTEKGRILWSLFQSAFSATFKLLH